MSKWNQFSAKKRMRIILWGLIIVGVGLATLSSFTNGQLQLQGVISNLSTGLISSAITFVLLNRQIDDKRNEEDLKQNLTLRLSSRDAGTALAAAEELQARGWLRDGTLRNAKLNEACLENANLVHANLQGAQLVGANLKGANLTYANLQGADLGNAHLERTDAHAPRAATLWYADLRDAKIGSATLYGVNLGGADLRGADLHGATLTAAEINDATKFDEKTRLPDGKFWTRETRMPDYTNRRIIGFA